MNEVVRYHNDMNSVSFNNFTEVELNIFFVICQQMREKNLSEIELSFERIRELANYTDRHLDRFVKNIDSTYKKLLESSIRIETASKIIRFVLFTRFEIDKDKRTVTIATNQKFEYILNALTSNFTRFELSEFVSLSKTNSKTLYRKLKQFRKTGFWSVDYREFLELMKMSKWNRTDINKEITRIVKDVAPFFQDLELEKIKKGGKRTGAIQRLEFKFRPEINKEIADKSSFLKFIEDTRNIYKGDVNKNWFPTLFVYQDKRIGVDSNGHLYVKETGENLQTSEAQNLWKYIFKHKEKIVAIDHTR